MKKIFFSLPALFYSLAGFCQKVEVEAKDGKLTVTKTEPWYASPWTWVVGAAVLILLLVALTRGGGRKD